MSKIRNGMLIVLSGPSGVGKDTVLRYLLRKKSNLQACISYTTRKPREGEINGSDYNFVSQEDFETMILQNKMLEYANYCGNYYGTPITYVDEKLKQGVNVILEIEVQGAFQVLKKRPDTVSIFVLPPSLSELRSRLFGRALDKMADAQKRMLKASDEIKLASGYQYVITNTGVEQCANDIIKIIEAESMKTNRNNYIIDEVLKK